LSRRRPNSWRMSLPGRSLFRAMVKPSLWIMMSMLASALVTNGDYMAIGILEDKSVVGLYFFGFQLTVAVLIMFTQSLRAVFLPSFVLLGMDRRRQEEAFLRSLGMASLLLFFVLFGMAAVANPVIGWVWSGKWDAAVPVVEIVAVACLARVISPIARSLLEARGAWRLVAGMSWLEGLGLVISATIGALVGGLQEIALSVGIYMILFGIFYIFVIQRHTAFSLTTVASTVLVPYGLAMAALAAAWSLAAVLQPFPGVLPEILFKGASYAAVFMILVAIFRRNMMLTIIELIRQRFGR
ncbi:MAG: oligosaccharide flippase family protein, partial [Alphaproteobacteria bacterium]|nr:oligosaccharide flippase family protein [Alphaproteobacteria bacterium]